MLELRARDSGLMFLTADQLVSLTGRRYATAQKRVLRERVIPFTEDGDGKPVVLVEDLRRMHGEPEPIGGPNRARLEALQGAR